MAVWTLTLLVLVLVVLALVDHWRRLRRRRVTRAMPATLEGGGSHLSAAPARGVPAPLGRRRLG